MLEDEARFGRITDPKRCWGPLGIRPRVNQQIIPEYTYAYGAGSAVDGPSDFLILPCMSADGMNLFLSELSYKYRDKFILLISDGAPSHSEGGLKIPPNMMLASLPAYSPQLNPVENIWEEIGEKSFPNLTLNSMDQLEMHLAQALMKLEMTLRLYNRLLDFNGLLAAYRFVIGIRAIIAATTAGPIRG